MSFASAGNLTNLASHDTSEINRLNRLAYTNYRDNPKQTITYAAQALALAQKTNPAYTIGIAEANRMLGIGNSSLGDNRKAIQHYLVALDNYQLCHNLTGQARVYNNIGNEYQEVDYDKALQFFNQALAIANKVQLKQLLASLNLNIGVAYYRKKQFTLSVNHYKISESIFRELQDTIGLISSLQNQGIVYFDERDFVNAKQLLTYAHDQAKTHDLNNNIAQIDLTLASLYAAENDFNTASKMLNEGKNYAGLVQSDKLLYDYLVTSYEFESKRKNYEAALGYLREMYKRDSILNRTGTSTQLTFVEEQAKQQAIQQKTMIELQRQSYNRSKFIAAAIVSGLLVVVVALLAGNIKRKAETNKRLTELNAEVSVQKDNLDRINHHLEEIIDERTKDLQDKNIKLSEYSSYLSHQIRGPVATLKGLLNLEKEGLLNQQECLNMMDKCVSDIDSKIIDVSDMLHDPGSRAK